MSYLDSIERGTIHELKKESEFVHWNFEIIKAYILDHSYLYMQLSEESHISEMKVRAELEGILKRLYEEKGLRVYNGIPNMRNTISFQGEIMLILPARSFNSLSERLQEYTMAIAHEIGHIWMKWHMYKYKDQFTVKGQIPYETDYGEAGFFIERNLEHGRYWNSVQERMKMNGPIRNLPLERSDFVNSSLEETFNFDDADNCKNFNRPEREHNKYSWLTPNICP